MWDGKDEVDIIALNGKGSFLFCECKWTARKLGVSVLAELENKVRKFSRAKNKNFGFFSKSGFTRDLKELAERRSDIMLFEY